MLRTPCDSHRQCSAVTSQRIGRPHGMWFAIPAAVFMFVCAPGHFGVEAWIVARHGAMTVNRPSRPTPQAHDTPGRAGWRRRLDECFHVETL